MDYPRFITLLDELFTSINFSTNQSKEMIQKYYYESLRNVAVIFYDFSRQKSTRDVFVVCQTK